MKKTSKRIIALLMSGCMLFMSGCQGKQSVAKPQSKDVISADVAEVWGCIPTYKVLQNQSAKEYEAIKGEAKIELNVAKGEYEAYQIMISAKKDVTYDFIVSNLTSDSGEKFSAELVDVFHEKYMDVKVNYNSGVIGMYPDAIVPLENIKDNGENKVKKDENQGVYVRFNIPNEQAAGVYTGTFTIKVQDEEQKIPVRLNVMNIEVPVENHVKSTYLVYYGNWLGEQDGSQEMLTKYNEMLYDYRLCTYNIMLDNTNTDEDIAEYTEIAYQHMQNPKCSFVIIPTVWTGGTIDVNMAKKYLMAFAEKSFETGYNMLAKAGTYITAIDEPDGFGVSDDVVKTTSLNWTGICQNTADELEADKSITSPIKAEVIASMRELYNVLTTTSTRYYDLGATTLCPLFTGYDSESQRERYENQKDKWWYGCCQPRAPYPNYSIDIQSLVGIRVMGWMQADYDVVGNLFWATDFYSKKVDTSRGGSVPLEDYYSTPNRFPQTNGDGFLFYPGARYGIDGPVASLRLEAIRDGFEEYELLCQMKQRYAQTGTTVEKDYQFDSDALMNYFAEAMYFGAKVTADDATYTQNREFLLHMCEWNYSEAEVYFTDYQEDKTGKRTYKFYVKDGAVLLDDGKEVTDCVQLSGGSLYTIVVDLSEGKEMLNLSVKVRDKAYEYAIPLGGQYMLQTADLIKTGDIKADSAIQYDIVSTTPALQEEGIYGKLSLPAVGPDEEQVVWISGDFISKLNEETDKASLKFILDSEAGVRDSVGGLDEGQKLSLIVSAKFKKNVVLVDLAADIELSYGVNDVQFPLSEINWDKVGELEYIQLKFGEQGEQARTLYLGDMSIYTK